MVIPPITFRFDKSQPETSWRRRNQDTSRLRHSQRPTTHCTSSHDKRLPPRIHLHPHLHRLPALSYTGQHYLHSIPHRQLHLWNTPPSHPTCDQRYRCRRVAILSRRLPPIQRISPACGRSPARPLSSRTKGAIRKVLQVHPRSRHLP